MQRNCDLADALHAGDLTLCTYLLEMRELYRWQHQLPLRPHTSRAEVLIEDFGYEALAKPVVKPLEGIKFASYVGCQTNRPFGIAGESFENPVYLDKLVETVGVAAKLQAIANER